MIYLKLANLPRGERETPVLTYSIASRIPPGLFMGNSIWVKTCSEKVGSRRVPSKLGENVFRSDDFGSFWHHFGVILAPFWGLEASWGTLWASG